MASRRMIASDIFEDEFFCELSHIERLLWIGLIAQCADDQGRLQDKPNSINSRIFPDDDIPAETISKGIKKFTDAGKIIRYKSEGKSLIQIAKWWSYQTPSWAMPSKYPSPENWIDRTKYHAVGNIIVTENWSTPGGYVDNYVPPLHSDIEESKGNESKGVEGDFALFDDTFKIKTRIINYTPMVAIKAFETITKAGATIEDMVKAIEELDKKHFAIYSPQSIVNPTINCMNYRLRNANKLPETKEPKTFIDVLADGTQITKELVNVS